jgi:hypothetical protein
MARTEAVFLFMTVDPETGSEGIVWHENPGHPERSGPLLAIDWERVESLSSLAQMMANESGLDITLAKFQVRVDGQKFHPQHKRETPGNE